MINYENKIKKLLKDNDKIKIVYTTNLKNRNIINVYYNNIIKAILIEPISAKELYNYIKKYKKYFKKSLNN